MTGKANGKKKTPEWLKLPGFNIYDKIIKKV